jgi:hypothetical protein
LVWSLCVTAISRSASSSPALASTDGYGRVAGHRLQVETILQVGQTILVAIDDRDVVVFRDETLGDTGTDLAGAKNDDPHFF